MRSFGNVDDYIASFPEEVQTKLKTIRKLVRDRAPKATEKISYGIPSYHLNGQLIYFAAFKEHIGLYPMKTVIKEFKKDLQNYETSAGTIRFPLDKPLPLPLIKRIIDFLIKQKSGDITP